MGETIEVALLEDQQVFRESIISILEEAGVKVCFSGADVDAFVRHVRGRNGPTVAVVDLLGAANVVRAQTFQIYQPLLLVAGIYICLTFMIETGFGLAERRSMFRRAN